MWQALVIYGVLVFGVLAVPITLMADRRSDSRKSRVADEMKRKYG